MSELVRVSSRRVLVSVPYCIKIEKTLCPHCGRDSREISARYRDGGYLAIETMQRIDRAVERRGG